MATQKSLKPNFLHKYHSWRFHLQKHKFVHPFWRQDGVPIDHWWQNGIIEMATNEILANNFFLGMFIFLKKSFTILPQVAKKIELITYALNTDCSLQQANFGETNKTL